MPQLQPDPRIKVDKIGVLSLGGRRYVIHAARGCPRNACIENFDGHLRCWACHTPLTEEAAAYVRNNAHPKDDPQGQKNFDAFVWNDNFYHRSPRKVNS